MKSFEASGAGARFFELLERVAGGEEFTISKDGGPVARPISTLDAQAKPDCRAAVEAMKAFGKGNSLGGLSIREMIEEGRRF